MEDPKNGQESYLICGECGSIQLTYQPLSHQDEFHRDPHKFKMFAGGYGSGKSRTGAEEIVQHILSTPNGMTFIGAQTKPQLDQTAKKMFFDVFPAPLIEEYHKQRDELKCKNGHTVLFRSCDDEGKIRSLNLSAFWIEEASEVKYDIFVQLTTRLRHGSTKYHQGILTSNPDLGWIRTEFLMKSDQIHNSQVPYAVDEEEKNPHYSVHIAPTELNPYLPPDFVETLSKGRPLWWQKRFLHGSFEFTEGQVFPMAAEAIIQPFEIPEYWERCFGCDLGLRDPLAFLAGAIDPVKGVLHIYQEHYEALRPVQYHAKKMHEMMDHIPAGIIRYVVCDPAGKKRSNTDFRSTFDHFAEYGIYFKDAQNRIEDGLMKMYTYFDLGKVKIHANCRNLIREITNYKYKQQELDQTKNLDEKPVDKDNHAVDALRYLMMELSDNPDQLINPSYQATGYFIKNQKKQKNIPFELQSQVNDYRTGWGDYY